MKRIISLWLFFGLKYKEVKDFLKPLALWNEWIFKTLLWNEWIFKTLYGQMVTAGKHTIAFQTE